LRDAWWSGHIAGSPGSMLVYPSVDFVRGRLPVRFTEFVYVALHASLFDLLGPFTEVSTRSPKLDVDRARTDVFWLSFVVPRADVELGVPTLTTHLTLGVGAALRFFRADNPDAPAYCVVCGSCGGRDHLTWGNSEFSVFLKYVP
jgi:hypothetical protein